METKNILDNKKIEEAAYKFATSQEHGELLALIDDYKEGYKDDINELLKDLWHPASEEPKLNKEILVNWRTENRSVMFLQTKLNNWKKLSNQEIKCWLYVDDLLPK